MCKIACSLFFILLYTIVATGQNMVNRVCGTITKEIIKTSDDLEIAGNPEKEAKILQE